MIFIDICRYLYKICRLLVLRIYVIVSLIISKSLLSSVKQFADAVWCVYVYIYIYIYIYIYMCVCLCVCLCVCVCLHPSIVKASSVWISWDTRKQINDVVSKTLDSSAGSLHLYFGMQSLTFQLATLSCLYTRSGHSHDLTSSRLAFRT